MKDTGRPTPKTPAESLGPCPICGREMLPGTSLDRHHWVPRSAGGTDWGWVHQVCHRMIHRVFSDAELATRDSDAASIRAHPDMARFIAWVRRKPPEYVDWPKSPRRGGRAKR